ncbi:hypothetical protein C6361_00690 [Plantactinospora sp. BC1]|nr:hypothetical protein C6361_00690 [Plantactinospora sp. BC1]
MNAGGRRRPTGPARHLAGTVSAPAPPGAAAGRDPAGGRHPLIRTASPTGLAVRPVATGLAVRPVATGLAVRSVATRLARTGRLITAAGAGPGARRPGQLVAPAPLSRLHRRWGLRES